MIDMTTEVETTLSVKTVANMIRENYEKSKTSLLGRLSKMYPDLRIEFGGYGDIAVFSYYIYCSSSYKCRRGAFTRLFHPGQKCHAFCPYVKYSNAAKKAVDKTVEQLLAQTSRSYK